MGFPCGSDGKEFACNVGVPGSIPESGKSPGEGKGYPLQYSGLENSMDCIVHGVAKSQTQLSDFHFSSSDYVSSTRAEIVPFVAESQAPRIVSGPQQTLRNSPLNDWPNVCLTSLRLAACWSQTDPNSNPDPSLPNSVTFGSLTNLSMLQSLH